MTVNYRSSVASCKTTYYCHSSRPTYNEFESPQLAMIVKSCSYSDRNHRTILPFNISNVRKLWVRRTKCGIRKGQRGGRICMFYRPQNRQEWAGESLKEKAVLTCVESDADPTAQSRLQVLYFKSLSVTTFEKVDKRSQKAFQCLQWTLANSAKFFNRFDAVWFSSSFSSMTALNEHWGYFRSFLIGSFHFDDLTDISQAANGVDLKSYEDCCRLFFPSPTPIS